jgi:hypothetical protein
MYFFDFSCQVPQQTIPAHLWLIFGSVLKTQTRVVSVDTNTNQKFVFASCFSSEITDRKTTQSSNNGSERFPNKKIKNLFHAFLAPFCNIWASLLHVPQPHLVASPSAQPTINNHDGGWWDVAVGSADDTRTAWSEPAGFVLLVDTRCWFTLPKTGKNHHPSKLSFAKLFDSGQDNVLVTLCGFDHTSFTSLHAKFKVKFDKYTPYSCDGQIWKLPHQPQHEKRCGQPHLLLSIQSLGLGLAWTRTQGSYAVLQVVFGLTPGQLLLWLQFSRRLVVKVLRHDALAKVTVPTDLEIRSFWSGNWIQVSHFAKLLGGHGWPQA